MASKIAPAPLERSLADVAQEINYDYASRDKPVYFGAVPYLEAMSMMDTGDLSVKFIDDPAADVVIYLLSNLSYWRGETATRIKNELSAALEDYKITQKGLRGR